MVLTRYILLKNLRRAPASSHEQKSETKKTELKGKAMDIYQLEMEGIKGETINFADYRDEALLVVNLASQ